MPDATTQLPQVRCPDHARRSTSLTSIGAEAQQTQPTHPAVVHKAALPAKAEARQASSTSATTAPPATAKRRTRSRSRKPVERCSVFGGGAGCSSCPRATTSTGALTLRSNVTLHIEEGATLNGSTDLADYPFAQVRWEGHWIKGYNGFISATDAQNIGLIGKGKIVGNPTLRGRASSASTNLRYPALIEFNNCKNVRVEDLHTEQFGMWSTHPVYCENVTFKNVSFKSAADGIDVDSCKHTIIEDGCILRATLATTPSRSQVRPRRRGQPYRPRLRGHAHHQLHALRRRIRLHRHWQRNLWRRTQRPHRALQVHRRPIARHLHQEPHRPRRIRREHLRHRRRRLRHETRLPADHQYRLRQIRWSRIRNGRRWPSAVSQLQLLQYPRHRCADVGRHHQDPSAEAARRSHPHQHHGNLRQRV